MDDEKARMSVVRVRVDCVCVVDPVTGAEEWRPRPDDDELYQPSHKYRYLASTLFLSPQSEEKAEI